MANQFLSLALFLMLLSFFIVMNGMSNFEESKSVPVMNSIALAFSSGSINNSRAPFDEKNNQLSMGSGDTLESLEGLFNTYIAGFDVSRNRLGTVMHVQTSVAQFKNAISVFELAYDDINIGDKGAFILTMVTLLRSAQEGVPYRVDIVVNIPKTPTIFQKQNPDEFIKNLKLVSGFAQALEKAGMPNKMLSAGLAKGKAGFVDLYFYKYKPMDLSSQINLEE